MRNLLLVTILAASTTILAPSSPVHAQYQQCIKGRGCVPASQRSYNACFNLALARGESAAWGERRSLNWFIYHVLPGGSPSMGIVALKPDNPVDDSDLTRMLASDRIGRRALRLLRDPHQLLPYSAPLLHGPLITARA
jgi:hypothetical protein